MATSKDKAPDQQPIIEEDPPSAGPQAAAETPAPAAKIEPAPAPTPLEVSGELEQAFMRILAAKSAAANKETAATALKELTGALGSLSIEDFRLIMGTEEMQNVLQLAATNAGGPRKPGDPIYDDAGREVYREPYSWSWCLENMEQVTWTVPPHPVGRRVWESPSWNGVICQVTLRANEEVTTPKVFQELVMETYRTTIRVMDSQATILATVPSRAADGVSVETPSEGWMKPTTEELVASGQWREV